MMNRASLRFSASSNARSASDSANDTASPSGKTLARRQGKTTERMVNVTRIALRVSFGNRGRTSPQRLASLGPRELHLGQALRGN